jgi:uncharacterized membrane protein YtjA (UPF0391 family)
LLLAGADAPAGSGSKTNGKENNMLFTIAAVLIILWLLGLITSYTMGGIIHLLLVVALVMIVLSLFSGRRGA